MKNKVIVNGIDVLEDIEYKENLIKDLKDVVSKQYKLLELYRELITIKDEAISIVYFDAEYFGTEMEEIEKDLEKQIKELENEK